MTHDLIKDSNTTLNPRIYVACLASYNNGILYGAWIEVAHPLEDILKQIKRLLDKSPIPGAEEYGIHDAEDFGTLRIGEYEDIETIHQKACFIAEHGELGAELLAYYNEVEFAEEALENYYRGEYESELEFAIHLFDNCYLEALPESVQPYIDYEKFQRDIFLGDYFSLNVNSKCYVFMIH